MGTQFFCMGDVFFLIYMKEILVSFDVFQDAFLMPRPVITDAKIATR